MYVGYPLSLRQVEDLLSERGIDVCHETVRYWWNRFGPLFAAEIRKRRVHHHSYSNWRWHLDEVFVRINGETHYLWRAVDSEGEVLDILVQSRRNKKAALRIKRKLLKKHSFVPVTFVTDKLPSYGAALKDLGLAGHHDFGGRKTNMQLSKFRLILTGLFYYLLSSTVWRVAANLTIRNQTESGFILTGAHPCASLTTNGIVTLIEGGGKGLQ